MYRTISTLTPILILLGLLLAGCGGDRDEQERPWDVQPSDDGGLHVLGITLGETPLSAIEARRMTRMQVAVFEGEGGELAAEAFFRELNFGGLYGRLHVNLELPRETLEAMRAAALAREGEDARAGARNYPITSEYLDTVRQAPVTSMSFIPYAEFTEELIVRHFGEPSERYAGVARQTHYHYPERGIEVIHDPEGKEVIQYVRPRDFHRLREPWEDGD